MCSPLHQGKEQSDTKSPGRFFYTLLVEVMRGKKRIVGGRGERDEGN